MELANGVELRERRLAEREPGLAGAAGAASRGPPLSGTSYWLDLWLMAAFNLALFVFVYLLP
uniref:Uncharacterized protein n=1 Tax=Podarcis muralis TaxID=64176 RepID=A0A670IT23_PODMU